MAWARRTADRVRRKRGFGVRELGVGGIVGVVPIAVSDEGGLGGCRPSSGRRVRIYPCSG